MRDRKHNGYILIMLLVVIAIGLMIYYMDFMWMGTDGQMFQKQPQDENQPWKDEALIRGPNQLAKPQQKSAQKLAKPLINKPLVLSGDVTTKDVKRGQLNFTIQPDGTITGNWQCEYSYTHSAYVIAAAFKGNTDSTQTLSSDPSMLFLIAMGDYLQKATNLESGEVTETKGTIYVKGWLGLDLTASGTLSITTDKKWHVDYKWMAVTN